MQRARHLAILVLFAGSALSAAEVVRIGDPGSVFDPSRYDAAYPNSKEWAKAGVQGGVPFRTQTPVVARVEPGGNIQAAINSVGGSPGVVLLARGVHPITQRIELRDNVILRGEDRDETIVSYDIGSAGRGGLGLCILMRKIERAGLEDLTLQHARVAELDHDKYHESYTNHPEWASGDNATVEINKARNCWVQHCKIIWNVNRPVRVWAGSSHITLRDNIVDYAVQRGGQGSSYYEVVGATYVLMYNEKVSRIRHVCLDGTIDYCVLTHCHLEVDVNWHCIPPMGKSLVTDCYAGAREAGHRWPPFCHYVDPVPTSNLIYKCTPEWNDGRVYCTEHPGKPFVKDSGRPPPKHGTLYPVTGRHIPYEQIAADKLLVRLGEAESARDWPVVQACCARLITTGALTGDEQARVERLDARAEAAAAAALATALEEEEHEDLLAFLGTWKHAACRERGVAEAERRGTAVLDELEAERRPDPEDWQEFLAAWQGLAVAGRAQERYDELAATELAGFRDRYKPETRSWMREALEFLGQWRGSAAATTLDQEVAAILDPVLAKLMKMKTGRDRAARLQAFVRSFAPSSTAARARQALSDVQR